jgi:hypothetical protein
VADLTGSFLPAGDRAVLDLQFKDSGGGEAISQASESDV